MCAGAILKSNYVSIGKMVSFYQNKKKSLIYWKKVAIIVLNGMHMELRKILRSKKKSFYLFAAKNEQWKKKLC